MSAEADRDLRLERQVLGAILGFDVWPLYQAAGLREEDFYRHQHKLIFVAIEAVAVEANPDIVTVGRELRARGQIGEVGESYFAALLDGIPKPSFDSALMETAALEELAARRALQQAGTVLSAEAGTDGTGAVDRHLERLDAILSRRQREHAPLDSDGQLKAFGAEVEREKAARLYLGFPTIDNYSGGLRPGEVFGLMARPGIGKTLWLCNAAQSEHVRAVGHVFFSLEMPAAQIVDRLMRMAFGLPGWRLRKLWEQGALDATVYHACFGRLVIVDAPGLSVAGMGTVLRQVQMGPLRGTPIGLVTVDHLGLIGGDRKMSTYDRVSTQARELKELAKRHGVGVLLAIQVNRDAGGDGSRELTLGSARDTGVVEEAMDYLLALRRLDRSVTLPQAEREKYRNCLFARLVKNRHGDLGDELGVRLDPDSLQLREDLDLKAMVPPMDRITQISGRLPRG